MAFKTVGLGKLQRKKSIVYYIDYTINGKRIRKVVGSNKRTAEAYRASIKEKLDKGEIGIEDRKIISFDDLVDMYFNLKKDSWRPKTITRYREFVKDFKTFFNKHFASSLSDITLIKTVYIQESIRTFRKGGGLSKKKWSSQTANSYKTFLASLFKFALKKGYVKTNPVSMISDFKVEKNIKIKFYSEEELEKIFANLPSPWLDFCKFLLLTGLRVGEAINLRWENVDLKNQQPVIYVLSNPEQNWVTKTCTSRKVPINKTVKSILIKHRNDDSKYVFINKGKQISDKAPLPALQKVLKKLNLVGNIHQFRHTFGTRYLVKNNEFNAVYSLMKIMGHKKIDTTMQYVHLVDNYMYNSMNNLD